MRDRLQTADSVTESGEPVDFETVSVTPHLAGATVETRTRMLRTTAENMLALLDGDRVDEAFVANPEALEY